MTDRNSLALFGGTPLFEKPLRPGQHFLPDWTSYEAMFRDIFERQYYTNQGPLTQQFEERIADYVGVRHAICMTNEFVGLVSLTFALGVHDHVIVPALSSRAMREALRWTAAQPVYCDVDAATGLLTAPLVEQALDRCGASAILAVNPWGDACPIAELETLAARRAVTLHADSSHGFGCAIDGHRLGSFADAEVISFHSDNVLSTLEGCVVCTDDTDVGAYLRNMRSSYGMGRPFPVPQTTNGRMSEAQAALGLFGLEHLDEHISRNEGQFVAYQAGLADLPGISIRTPQGVGATNYQNLICLVDEAKFGLTRDELIRALRAENVIASIALSAALRTADRGSTAEAKDPFPNALRYAARAIELPIGASVTDADIVRIVDRFWVIKDHAGSIRRLGGSRP